MGVASVVNLMKFTTIHSQNWTYNATVLPNIFPVSTTHRTCVGTIGEIKPIDN